MSSFLVRLGHVSVVLRDFDSLAQFWGLFDDIFHLGKFSIFQQAAACRKIENLPESSDVENVINLHLFGPRVGRIALFR